MLSVFKSSFYTTKACFKTGVAPSLLNAEEHDAAEEEELLRRAIALSLEGFDHRDEVLK